MAQWIERISSCGVFNWRIYWNLNLPIEINAQFHFFSSLGWPTDAVLWIFGCKFDFIEMLRSLPNIIINQSHSASFHFDRSNVKRKIMHCDFNGNDLPFEVFDITYLIDVSNATKMSLPRRLDPMCASIPIQTKIADIPLCLRWNSSCSDYCDFFSCSLSSFSFPIQLTCISCLGWLSFFRFLIYTKQNLQLNGSKKK